MKKHFKQYKKHYLFSVVAIFLMSAVSLGTITYKSISSDTTVSAASTPFTGYWGYFWRTDKAAEFPNTDWYSLTYPLGEEANLFIEGYGYGEEGWGYGIGYGYGQLPIGAGYYYNAGRYGTINCGNGTIDTGEYCDDSNTSDGDGCTKYCAVERDSSICNPESINYYDGKEIDVSKGVVADGLFVDLSGGAGSGWEYRIDGDGTRMDGFKKSVGDYDYRVNVDDAECYLAEMMGTNPWPEECELVNYKTDGKAAAAVEISEGGSNDGFYQCKGFYTNNEVAVTADDCLYAFSGVITPSNPVSYSVLFNFDDPFFAGTVCGDGDLNIGEACDDGNPSAGDGCTSACTIELGYICTSASPSVCIFSPTCGGYEDVSACTTDLYNLSCIWDTDPSHGADHCRPVLCGDHICEVFENCPSDCCSLQGDETSCNDYGTTGAGGCYWSAGTTVYNPYNLFTAYAAQIPCIPFSCTSYTDESTCGTDEYSLSCYWAS